MSAYILIAFELLTLYFAFWYVFVREPKPYKVKGNMWGTYSRASQTVVPNGMECCGVVGNAAPSFEQMVAQQQRVTKRRSTRHAVAKRHQPDMRYGWVAAEEEQHVEGVSAVTSIFRNAFDALALKLS